MVLTLFLLFLALLVILIAAELFTNALEHVGERLGVSEGVTGSVFAAVGTALPEAIVPVVALLAGGPNIDVNQQVAMGAIMGAPFMLGTLTLGLMAVFAGMKRGWNSPLSPESSGIQRDVSVFLIGFSAVLLVGFLPESWDMARVAAALGLGVLYFLYTLRVLRASKALVDDGHVTEADHPLFFEKLGGNRHFLSYLQLLLAFILLIFGAKWFVHEVEYLSQFIKIPVLILSLLIIPVATELPEKINSILWIRRKKDTLAFGNITGAMVFQGTLIPACGMLLMPWVFTYHHPAVISSALAMLGIALMAIYLRTGHCTPRKMLVHLVLYGMFVAYVSTLL